MPSLFQFTPGEGREFLVCPPTHFDLRYAINPFMKAAYESGIQVDKSLAFEQWMQLLLLLKALGARGRYIMSEEGTPDMVFTANAGFLFKNRFVPSHFRYEERRGEEIHFLRYFSKIPGVIPTPLPRPDYFEGRGDVLWHGNTLLCGYGFRSSIEGMSAMVRAIGYTGSCVFLELADERFYHLDTCFCSLGKDILWYPPAFSPSAQKMLRHLSNAGKSVVVSEEGAMRLACNGIYFERKGRRALVTSPLSHCLRSELEELNIMVFENDVSEFLKAGGGNQCLVFPLK